jgi:hypothetical protein
MPLMEEFFPWKSDGESSTCLFHAADGLSSLNPILIFSCSKRRRVTAWAGLSNVVYRYGAFLLNSLKVMALLHHTSLRHTMCSMTAPYHKHQHPSAFQSWSRVWIPNTPLSVSLITSSFPLFFTMGVCLWIRNRLGIILEPSWTLLNHIVNHSTPLAQQEAPDRDTLSHWFR